MADKPKKIFKNISVSILLYQLISLIVSLGISIREILISVRALEIHLEGMENGKKE